MNHFFNYANPYLAGNNYNYTPQNHYGFNQFSQPMQPNMTAAPTSVATSTNTNKIYVSGIDEVKTRILPPDSDMLFIDNERDVLYEKTVDNTGKFQIKTFDIVEHKDPVNDNKPLGDKLPEYATKSDLEPFYALKTQYESQLAEQNDTIKALRGELKKTNEKLDALTNIQTKMIEKGGE